MQAVYDLVLVETVGVGQSETEVAGMTDAVMLCIQPASGDSLQFMKAGIMEIPDVAVVTKADLGGPARRAAADLRTALSVAEGDSLPVHLCSSQNGEGVSDVFDAIVSVLEPAPRGKRPEQAQHWLKAALLADFGTEGVRALGRPENAAELEDPFAYHERCRNLLCSALANLDFIPENHHKLPVGQPN
jgi:LAO/AO transport system kinase